MLEKIGDGGLVLGARAQQIRDGLRALDRVAPEDLLALQLDDRALFLERWRTLLLELLDDEAVADSARRAELRDLLRDGWTGRASIDSAAFRMVRAFRLFLAEDVFTPITASCTEAQSDFRFLGTGHWEGSLWRLVEERPPHLLDPEVSTWREMLLATVDRVIENFSKDPATGEETALRDRSWGQRNTVRMQHPLSLALPQLSGLLDAPFEALPGDSGMPRVQGVGFGASERFVVSPGREESGIFHMPGGQSGHFLSPFYLAGHEAWARGEPTPFLPGETLHELKLLP